MVINASRSLCYLHFKVWGRESERELSRSSRKGVDRLRETGRESQNSKDYVFSGH